MSARKKKTGQERRGLLTCPLSKEEGRVLGKGPKGRKNQQKKAGKGKRSFGLSGGRAG